MSDLPMSSLQYFPVQYPRSFVASGVPPSRTKPRAGGGSCPTLVTFSDDFNANRHGVAHNAIDIFGAFDLEILATTAGVVPTSWRVEGEDRPGVGTGSDDGGFFVMIQDGAGRFHYYAHLGSPPLVRPGEAIPAGRLIGYLGDSGRARTTCQHLHYQVSRRTHGLAFFNPYRELRRLAVVRGATPGHGERVQVPLL